jgi:hypothetical protein
VGGEDEAQTYILLSNPGQTARSATLTFPRTDGTTVVKTVDVPAASRITFGVTGPQGAAPELVNESFGTRIESTQTIIVERSLYSNANGIMWAAGPHEPLRCGTSQTRAMRFTTPRKIAYGRMARMVAVNIASTG